MEIAKNIIPVNARYSWNIPFVFRISSVYWDIPEYERNIPGISSVYWDIPEYEWNIPGISSVYWDRLRIRHPIWEGRDNDRDRPSELRPLLRWAPPLAACGSRYPVRPICGVGTRRGGTEPTVSYWAPDVFPKRDEEYGRVSRREVYTLGTREITMETFHDKDSEHCIEAMSRLSTEKLKCTRPRSKGETRGQKHTGLTHECGVFGCISAGDWPSQIDVAQVICLGLVALQHRGQESAGIVTSEGVCSKSFHVHKGMGMINNIFNDENMRKLKGNLGIGHTRYSTSAASEEVNCQPFVVHTAHGALAVAHNGELVNTESLRKMVLGRGVGLSTHSDSELITQALCLNPPEGEVNGPDWPARIKHLMQLAPLSYSLVIMQRDKIYGVRDPYGNRPLCLGKIVPIGNLASNESDDDDDEAEGWVISSESCGFLSIGARYVREVFPGEIVELTREGIKTIEIVERPNKKPQAFCIFEYVYFARSDSIFEGQMVYSVRMQCGRVLAIESPVEADIVSSVPESGTAAAHGYARQSKIPFAEVLCKNRYVGRTFIQPSTRLRQLGVAKKFGALSENVKGRKIVLVDDSIVRGNTIGPIIKLLRDAGAKEVHVRIASPPLKYPCYMGINIPTREELIANKLDNVKLAKHAGADSLTYLSVEGLVEAVRYRMDNRESNYIGHCTACLTGEYPDELPGDLDW